MSGLEKVVVFAATALMAVMLCGGIIWNLSLPVVQVDSATNEKVAVITSDGTVHPPSYLEEAQITHYTPEYVAPGYRPTKYGIKEWELRALK